MCDSGKDTRQRRHEEMRDIYARTTTSRFVRLVTSFEGLFQDYRVLSDEDEFRDAKQRLWDGNIPFFLNTLVLRDEEGHPTEFHLFAQRVPEVRTYIEEEHSDRELAVLAIAYCAQRAMRWPGVMKNRWAEFNIHSYDVHPLMHTTDVCTFPFIMRNMFLREELTWWPSLFHYRPVDSYTFAMLHRVADRQCKKVTDRSRGQVGLCSLEPELVVSIIEHWINLHVPRGASVELFQPFVPWW